MRFYKELSLAMNPLHETSPNKPIHEQWTPGVFTNTKKQPRTQQNNHFLVSKLMYLFLSTNRKEIILAILGSFQYPGNFQPRHSKFPRCIAVVKRPRGERTNEDCPKRPPWKTSLAYMAFCFFASCWEVHYLMKKTTSCVTCFWVSNWTSWSRIGKRPC